MKSIVRLLLLLLLGVYSCDKLPQNDALDGMWHLQKIHHLNSITQTEEDVSAQQIYWCVQLDLLQIKSNKHLIYRDEVKGRDTYNAFCRFEHKGNSLNVNKVYLSFDVMDSLLTDPNTRIMEPYGIVGCADSFHIEHLGSKQMILVSDDKRLMFRKF